EVARKVPTSRKAFAITLLLVQIAAKHGRPSRSERQLAFASGFRYHFDASVLLAAHDTRFDPRQRAPHRTRTNIHRGIIGDHDAAGFRLPPVIMNRQAKRFLPPHHGLGIERLADTREEPEVVKVVFTYHFRADFHHHAHRRRRRIPDGDFLVPQDAVPALRIELRFV